MNNQDDDPLAGVANLFDVAMVFCVALGVALILRAPQLLNEIAPNQDQAQGEELKKFEYSERPAKGNGRRLGVAYKLESGEIICVTEKTGD